METTTQNFESTSGSSGSERKLQCCKKHKICVLCIIAILVVLICLKILVFGCGLGRNSLAGSHNTWKAIFLTNGQVYFGKVAMDSRRVLVLQDVYYIQQVPTTGQNKDQSAPQLSLVRLGEEMHGPTNEVRVNRDQILFVETLRTDSRIVQSIAAQKNK